MKYSFRLSQLEDVLRITLLVMATASFPKDMIERYKIEMESGQLIKIRNKCLYVNRVRDFQPIEEQESLTRLYERK